VAIRYDTGADAYLELDCGDFSSKGASVGHGPDGTTFQLRCGPLREGQIARLEYAAKSGAWVRLVFSRSHVVLANVLYQRIEPDVVVLAGRIVETRDRERLNIISHRKTEKQ
jgi:hypothetical protein